MKNISFQKFEPCFFFIITSLTLSPVLFYKFFPTMDGAAHLYNSNLIVQILFHNNEILNRFFQINTYSVPNCSGHFILVLFNSFLPAFLAEKILLILYLAGLPFSFRCLVLTISPQSHLLTYLIFPFTYTFLFYLGFYNFSLGIVLLFITLNYWIKTEYDFSVKSAIGLFFLCLSVYFSHLFIFILLCIILAMLSIWQVIINIKMTKDFKSVSENYLKRAWLLLSVLFLPVLLSVYYFVSTPAIQANTKDLSTSKLIDWLMDIRPIITLSYEEGLKFTENLFYVLCTLLAATVFVRIKKVIKDNQINFFKKPLLFIKASVIESDIWLLVTLMILIMYFVIPNSLSAGMITDRLALMFFLCLVIWLSVQKIPKWISFIVIGITVYTHLGMLKYYFKATSSLNKDAKEYYSIAQQIPPNSVVLPLNYSEHWLQIHFSNYLGIDKPLIILENYEASLGWFPIKWNEKRIPNLLLGDKNVNDVCINWKNNQQNSPHAIAYVVIWGDNNIKTDSCAIEVKRILTDNYKLVFTSHNAKAKLYKIKG